METEVFPAIQRLDNALQQAHTTLQQINTMIQQAEIEAAGLFSQVRNDNNPLSFAPPPPLSKALAFTNNSNNTASPKPRLTAKEKRELIESLYEDNGKSTQAERDLVTKELMKLPEDDLEELRRNQVKIAIGKGSVTDILPDLKRKKPRGWPPDKTWDDVPGAYDSSSKRIVIALQDGKIPKHGQGHSSVNLVLHETAHALDHISGNKRSQHPTLVEKRAEYEAALGGGTYYKQEGNVGLEEIFTESYARHYDKNPAPVMPETP